MFREGDLADSMFFLLEGRVNILLPLDPGSGRRNRRLATFGHGVAFGEMALLDEGRRSADVVCNGPCTAAELSLSALATLDRQFPDLMASLHANLARLLARRLRRGERANTHARALNPSL